MGNANLWIACLSILLFISIHASGASQNTNNAIKSAVFLSPPIYLQPGSVSNKLYYDIPFPRGHIGLKSFTAEVVDEEGNPVPLHETYLHHWVVEPYYTKSGINQTTTLTLIRNSGICSGTTLGQYFGLGSETRRTSTYVPDPYGIEVGNPKETPEGYEVRWLLNVHAIDTRGVVDRLGCTECRCSLYNITKDASGSPLEKDYIGGLDCCYDQTQCRLKKGFEISTRKLYLRYTVKWVDWNENVKPVRIYIFDVTDTTWSDHTNSSGREVASGCKVEYDVKRCSPRRSTNIRCNDSKKAKIVIPRGGDIVYGVAHQHSGGAGATLFGQDGRVLCTSLPTYGKGQQPGNEAGYIVGMSTCYPKPGSVKVGDGEVLTLESNYSSTKMHTGVMGLFYIMVAEPQHLR